MSVQVRRRRETAAFLSTFVGAQGELLVDTTNNRVQVHDGTTPGGFPAARLADLPSSASPLAIAAGGTGATSPGGALAALGVIGRTPIVDSNYAVQTSDRTIAFTALTAARVVSLPAASAFPTGTQLLVVDESGQCSTTNSITLVRAGTDTIGAATSVVLTFAYGYVALVGNGASKWTIIDQSTTSLAQQAASSVAITGGTIDGTGIGATSAAAGSFTQIALPSAAGAAATPRVALNGDFTTSGGAGFGRGTISVDYCVPGSNSYHQFYHGGTLRHRLSGLVGNTYFYSLDSTPIGASTPSTIRGTIVTATTSLNLPSYTVATLPAAGTAGRVVFCSNARMQTATAGTLESVGAGTGGLVSDNGTAWKIVGTNINVTA